jgi:hypothetical protein
MSQEGQDIYSSLNIILPKTPNTTPRTPTNPDEFVDVSPISNYTGDTLTSEPQTPEENYRGSDNNVLGLLRDLPELPELINQPEEKRYKFVTRIGRLFGRIERAYQLFSDHLEYVINRYSSRIPTEGGNELHNPNLIGLVIEILIIILEFLPFLLNHSFVIIDYTLGSVINFQTIGVFDNDNIRERYSNNIFSTIGNVLFVKVTTILSNIYQRIMSGNLFYTYSSRLIWNYVTLLTMFYYLGVLSNSSPTLAPVIQLFFKITISVANQIPYPFNRLWLIPVDCGVEGLICAVPYDFRDIVYEPISQSKEIYNDAVGRLHAVKDEFVNTSQHFWNITTTFATSAILYLPTVSLELIENMTETISSNPDAFRKFASNTVETYGKDPTRKAFGSLIDSSVDMVSVFGEGFIHIAEMTRLSAMKTAVLEHIKIEQGVLDEMNYDDLNKLLELLLTPPITGVTEPVLYDPENPLSGPMNRMIIIPQTLPKAEYDLVPRVVVTFNPRYINLDDNIFIEETVKTTGTIKRDGLGRPIIDDNDFSNNNMFIKDFITINRRIQNRAISSININRIGKVNVGVVDMGSASVRKSFKMDEERDEVPKKIKQSRSMRPIQLIHKKEQETSLIVGQLKTASLTDSEVVKQNYAHFFGRGERGDEGRFKFIPDFKVNDIIDILDKPLKNLQLNLDNAVRQIQNIPQVVRDTSYQAVAFSVFKLSESGGDKLIDNLIVDVKSLLKELNTPGSRAYRNALSDSMTETLIEVGKFAGEVGLNVGTQVILKHATESTSYYVITPSLNFVTNMVFGILSVIASSGMRRIGNRGGSMYKKSVKQRIRHNKSTKKHKRHKKSTKKHRKHKKSSKKHRKHKKSTKK